MCVFPGFFNSNQDLSLRRSAPIGDRDVMELSSPKRMPLDRTENLSQCCGVSYSTHGMDGME